MSSNRGLASIGSRLPAPAGPANRQVAMGPLRWMIVAAFVAFLCSIPFEAALLFGDTGFFSISRLVGYGFFGLALLQPGKCFKKPPRALWWFVLYLGIYVLTGLYQPSAYWPEIAATAFRLFQFLLLLWVGYNLLQDGRVARWAFWGFGLACVAVAGLLAVGVGVSAFRGIASRQVVFGQGPNTLGAVIGLGAVALIGMVYGRVSARPMAKAAAWAGFLVVAVAIARTGSRGALVGVATGVMTLLASQGSARTRMRNAMIIVVALGASAWIAVSSATMASRWQRTVDEGSLSGRQRIWIAAFGMFEEKPLMGWGPATNYYELGRRLALPRRDTHNVFLWLLTEQGFVGSIPFWIGLWLCARAAWRGRKGAQGLLPLALLVAVLTVNQSGTYYVTKWFWLSMAYALASETYLRQRKQRRAVPLPVRPRLDVIARAGAAGLRAKPALHPVMKGYSEIGREPLT